ncbi:hypothetical protein CJP74_07315 [Psittacicella melopsittaci]|uniref:Nickel/cobalt efflux system n=1 Tax=Psittacicella melopsittaci TaxID=2028576 RepID=A0A3A1Y5V5_9GAMM|nr:hypothetical protein [Psittacicella melopsittaci]RIY31444.1 hypothetical protein CJP74_07315 [Psittacicella melopsittaci]
MKKIIIALVSLALILALLLVGFDYLYTRIMQTLGNFNNLLANLINQTQTSVWAGPTLVGLSFLYGVLHAIGPGHGKFVLASYSLATNPKFRRLAALGLTISLLQGCTAVILGSLVLYLFGSSVTYLFRLNDHLGVLSGALIGLLALFWLGRSLWRAIKIIRLMRAESKQVSHEHKHEHTCAHDHDSSSEAQNHTCSCSYEHEHTCKHDHGSASEGQSHTCASSHEHKHDGQNCSCTSSASSQHNHTHEHNHEHENEHKHEHVHKCNHDNCHTCSSSESHPHNCDCGNHMDWDKFNQLDSFRDRLIMATSIILRPCSGAIAVLIFAYAVDLWWWGVLSTMVMALGTGIGLIFAVQLVTFIKYLGFNKLFGKPSPGKSLFVQGVVSCIALALLFVSVHTAYVSYTSQENLKIYTRSPSTPLLKQNN